ncbi:MAG: biotin/lipoyl-binding protein [Rectinema sp.]|nr:biotin/lipoyl-binding protein [Rectinema sp.]
MKHYRITVNGKSYDVTVEDLGKPAHAASAVAPAPSAVAQPAAPTAPAAPAAAPASGATITVKAPMPGTVISYKVVVGQKVKRGDILLLLEAMKMENEIVAPQDGTVTALRVAASTAVNTGDPLVDIA